MTLGKLELLHASYKKGQKIKTCSDGFEIYELDELKGQFLFMEDIFTEFSINSPNRYINGGFNEQSFEKIKLNLELNLFKFTKACIFRYIFIYDLIYTQHSGKKENNHTLESLNNLIKYIFRTYNNFTDAEFYDLVYIISDSNSDSYWSIYMDNRNHFSIKNFFHERFEELLRKKEESNELIKALNYFFKKDIILSDLLNWKNSSSKIVNRGKDFYIIFDSDPYLEYQLEISKQLDLNSYIVLGKDHSWDEDIYSQKLIDNDVISKLIKNDQSNNYLKSIIQRYLFISKYYNFYYLYEYIIKYIEIINQTDLKNSSKEDILEILNYSLNFKLETLYKHCWYDFFTIFRSLAKAISNLHTQDHIDESIISAITRVIFNFNNEKISNHFFQVIGIVFYPDDLGKTVEIFLKKNNQYSLQFKEIFIDIYNLGKDSKVNEKKASEVKMKLKKLPENIVNELFNNFINSVLEIDLKNSKYTLLINSNETFFRGLLFLSDITNDMSLYTRISELCLKCFTKIPGVGAVSEKIGNACITALKIGNDLFCLSLIARLKYFMNLPKTRKFIIDILQVEAKKRGITIEEIEDMAIPNFGLKDGKIIFTFHKNEAQIEIKDYNNVDISWFNVKGEILKTIPSEIKENNQDKIKEIKNIVKEIEKTLSTQKERIDYFYLQDRKFKFQNWMKLFIENELLQFLGKKLIWKFSTGNIINAGFFNQNNFVDYKGNIINNLSEETYVSLWHPLDSSVQEVISWRDFISNNQIRQPFKQAYREIYLLTDAEIKTKTYSNRFAAHILRQHQFSSLARLRGWDYQLLGNYDDGRNNEIAQKNIDKWNITAEFWVNEMGESDDFNDAGIWLYVSTDQVRFRSGNTKLELKKVPEIVFSEIMRDVDLFVGVASIGNDPVWQDGSGENNNYNQYWQNYSFGDLSETSKTRKSALEKLLPKLKISEKCSIEGKFLKVKGDFRSYKIHLGSSNILMEPNDQYLCIVPDRKAKNPTENIFLPFEDDKIFSMVLSKAFLLANDTEINDETILNQIKLKI
jgi:hypothetical protein